MALIKCPECGQEVSDKAEKCIHCGYPIAAYSPNKYSYKLVINSFESDTAALAGINKVFDVTVDYNFLLKFLNNIPCVVTEFNSKEEADTYAEELRSILWGLKVQIDYNNNNSEMLLPYDSFASKIVKNEFLKCPFCNSHNVRSISGVERAASIVGLGLFSKKFNKSFKCNSCGGTF